MKKFLWTLATAISILALAGRASALCPDKIYCLKYDKTIGYVINYVPTCYKFLKGCRPWHCKKSDFVNTDQRYWELRCVGYIAGICEDAYGRVLCTVEYPLY